MRYTVVWRGAALNAIADLWMVPEDRGALTKAVDEADRKLAEDPGELGESYYGDRLVVIGRLAVTFQISKDDRLAEVVDVYWHPR